MLEWILEFVGREDHSNTIYLTNQKKKTPKSGASLKR
jgi:hypothetical protein